MVINKEHTINRTVDAVIVWLLSLILFVDTCNGILLANNLHLPISLSQFYKIAILSLMGVRILTMSINSIIPLLLIVTFLFISSVIHFFLSFTTKGFIEDVTISFKLLLAPLTFLYFKELVKRKPFFANYSFLKILKLNFYIIVFNLGIGLLGIGYKQYSNEIGFKGFFYAGNEVSGVLIILSSLLAFILWKEKNKKTYVFFSLVILAVSVIKVTKVAILGSIIIVSITPFFNQGSKFLKLSLAKIKLVFAFIILSPIMIYFVLWGSEFIGLTQRVLFLYRKYDLINFITSGRVDFLKSALKVIEDYSYIELLWGKGIYSFGQVFNNYWNGKNTVEIDFVDIFLYFGVLGLLLFGGLWTLFLYNSFTRFKFSYYGPGILLSNLLLLAISLLAGHIVYSGMAGVFIGMSNAMAYYAITDNEL